MSSNRKSASGAGRISPNHKRTPRIWKGWKGGVVHPQAPDGGGGPGFFREPNTLTREKQNALRDDLKHPSVPQPLNAGDEVKPTSPRVNKSPSTNVSQQPIAWIKESSDQVDVEVTYQILADRKDSSSEAETNLVIPPAKFTEHNPENKKIGKMTWKGSITIETIYSDFKNREEFTCYGRGTTASDRLKGDITLGFHESCHREDFVDYLSDISNKRPEVPKLTATMTKKEFDAASKKFIGEFKDYETAINAYTHQKTDEVGTKESTIKSSDDCFLHILPAEDE